MAKSVVYNGANLLGELNVIPVGQENFQFPNKQIHIHHISPQSERCPPLSIVQTLSPFKVRCKLESSLVSEQPHLINLHASCFCELKTAVVLMDEEEIHLVAMPSKQQKFPCFWCFSVPLGLYDSCLGMLNLRCLAIIFDLDETLVVANTLKSFEGKIDALKAWITRETDMIKSTGMNMELKRYMDDRSLLKQYAEFDYVIDNGKMFKSTLEEVPPICGTFERLVRPVIRLQEKGIILTRINPDNRDTSVLVRLRPAWEDLKSYLTAKGRKRFEVYVCTMAERDYALEVWRLLDPDMHLIEPKQLLERVICVRPGCRKSLINVFQGCMFHPKMAMVIDDRLKVWEDKDWPRVHVVPAFTPYYAPQAELAHAVPVLCVARNVACNVRGWFFKEFDENLIRKISEVFYEDDVASLPIAPDVSDCMMSEGNCSAHNNSGTAMVNEGIVDAEVDSKLQLSDSFNSRMFTLESLQPNLVSDCHYVEVLQEIGKKCSSKVEFKTICSNSKDLQFSVEVLFTSEKIGLGNGKTRQDAQQQAAQNALHRLAEKYVAYVACHSGAFDKNMEEQIVKGNGFIWNDPQLMSGSRHECPSEGECEAKSRKSKVLLIQSESSTSNAHQSQH